jgi:UDPglucose 6-dehydrogenase
VKGGGGGHFDNRPFRALLTPPLPPLRAPHPHPQRLADIIFVSVNTPTKAFGIGAGFASNVGNVEACARTIARVCADRPRVIVEKSTVPVKTAETLRRVIAANAAPAGGGGGSGAPLAHAILSNPEFLAEGTAVKDLQMPSRVLIGGEESPAGRAAVAQLAAVYAAWVPRERIITTNLWSSELSKLVANAFLAQRISSINSISALCEVTGADVDEVAKAIGTDPRIGPQFLKASVGFGGSCFKKDILNLVYLCRTYGLSEVADYWDGVVAMNEWQKERFARLILSRLFNSVQGKRIALLGFAFKKDTGDVRESAAAYVAAKLIAERAALVVYDPKVKRAAMLEELEYTCGVTAANTPGLDKMLAAEADPYDACKDAHAVAILTEWDSFKALDWERVYAGMSKPAFLFDGRNILNHAALRGIGFEVYAVGSPEP